MKQLSPSNGHVLQIALQMDSPTTGARVPATGLTVTGRISLTAGGAAIGTLSTALTEYAEVPGTYHGDLAGATLASQLVAVADGTELYEVYASGTDILISTPIQYKAVRWGEEAASCA